jgi:hypothetical protein
VLHEPAATAYDQVCAALSHVCTCCTAYDVLPMINQVCAALSHVCTCCRTQCMGRRLHGPRLLCCVFVARCKIWLGCMRYCCCYCCWRREDQLLFRPWSLLCNQLQYVVGEVLRFATIDVLEPLWGDMEAHLARAANMDEVRGQPLAGAGAAGVVSGHRSKARWTLLCDRCCKACENCDFKVTLVINERWQAGTTWYEILPGC